MPGRVPGMRSASHPTVLRRMCRKPG
jgi:hypothetical protein